MLVLIISDNFCCVFIDPQPPQSNWGHLILQNAGLKASQTLLPAAAKQTCMAGAARPVNTLVWTPHQSERFGKQLKESAFNQVWRLGAARAEAMFLARWHLAFWRLAHLRSETQPC